MDPLSIAGAVYLWESYFKAPTMQGVGTLSEKAKEGLQGIVGEKMEHVLQELNWQGLSRSARDYRQSLQTWHGSIPIFGKPDTMAWEDVYTTVRLLDRRSVMAYDEENLHTMFAKEPERFRKSGWQADAERLNGLNVAQSPPSKRLFILGKPGAGKTTYLKYLTVQALNGALEGIPIFINLPDWANKWLDYKKRQQSHAPQSCLDYLHVYIADQFKLNQFEDPERFISYILMEGRAVVMFDGLDEVRKEGGLRREIIQAIEDFCTQYEACQVMLSCRLHATSFNFARLGFKYMEIADLDDTQIRMYVKNYFKKNEAIGYNFLEELEKEVNIGVREMAKSPILLSLLCVLFESQQFFDPNRTELYRRALDVFLTEIDKGKGLKRDTIYEGLSLNRRKEMFAYIALQKFEDGSYFYAKSLLIELIEQYIGGLAPAERHQRVDVQGETVLDEVIAQHGMFVERAMGIFSFSHLTFQEFFVAQLMVDRRDEGAIDALIQNYRRDRRWREVFLFTFGLLPRGDQYMARFKAEIDKEITEDERFILLLKRADMNAQNRHGNYKIAAVRGMYVSFHITFVFGFPLALDLNLDLALDLDLALNLAPALALARALALNLAHDLNLDLVFTPDLIHGLKKAGEIGLDMSLVFAWQFLLIFSRINEVNQKDMYRFMTFYSSIKDMAKVHGSSTLQEGLEDIRSLILTSLDFKRASHQLRQLMIQERQVGYDDIEIEYDSDTYTCLEHYLKDYKLLIDCFKVTRFSSQSARQAFEDSLFTLYTPQPKSSPFGGLFGR